MKQLSTFFGLNWQDAVKSFLVAVLSAALTAVYGALTDPAGAPVNWNEILKISIIAGVGYIVKNFLTSSDGKFLSKEK